MSIRVTHENGVHTVIMDRPAKRNAFTLEMYRDFGAAVAALDADEDVRCIVVRGEGGAFCAGSDIGGFDTGRSNIEQAREYARFTLDMTNTLKDTRHPTVACIEGPCVGGGLEIALNCDVRIAARSARFGLPINRIGLCVDHEELADLIGVVGHTVALETLLQGHIFGAEEALQKGFVTQLADDDSLLDHAYQVATRIAQGAPLVNRWHKKFVRRLRSAQPLTAAERDEAYACFDTQDYRTGTAAFAKKERPVFEGR